MEAWHLCGETGAVELDVNMMGELAYEYVGDELPVKVARHRRPWPWPHPSMIGAPGWQVTLRDCQLVGNYGCGLSVRLAEDSSNLAQLVAATNLVCHECQFKGNLFASRVRFEELHCPGWTGDARLCGLDIGPCWNRTRRGRSETFYGVGDLHDDDLDDDDDLTDEVRREPPAREVSRHR